MPFAEIPLDIWLAAEKGSLTMVQQFISDGVSIDARDKGGGTPLLCAAKHGHITLVKWLLEQGANPNAKTKPDPGERQGAAPLHEAIMGDHDEIVELLLFHKAKVNLKMSDGSTPLILAAEGGRVDLVNMLLAEGADIHLSEQMGYSPFTVALTGRHFDIASLLLKRGSDINRRVEPFHCTLLMFAAEEKSLEEVRFLLAAGAEVLLEDDRGMTALHHAIIGGAVRVTKRSSSGKKRECTEDKPEHAVEIVKLLLAAGADPQAKDDEGQTPISMAMKYRLDPILELLVKLLPKAVSRLA